MVVYLQMPQDKPSFPTQLFDKGKREFDLNEDLGYINWAQLEQKAANNASKVIANPGWLRLFQDLQWIVIARYRNAETIK